MIAKPTSQPLESRIYILIFKDTKEENLIKSSEQKDKYFDQLGK